MLVVGHRIKAVSAAPIDAPPEITVTRLNGTGHTLMPGLIDARVRGHRLFVVSGRAETRVGRASGRAGTRSSGLVRHTGFSWRTDGACLQPNRTVDDT